MSDVEGPGHDIGGVCVVTQPARRTGGKTHAYQLCEVLSRSTDVSVLTANLDDDSALRREFDVEEVSNGGTGTATWWMALRFLWLQLQFAWSLARRDDEVVLFFGTTSYLLPILVAKLVGKSVVVQPRGDVPLSLQLAWERRLPGPVARLLADLLRLLERVGYALADAVVTYTPSMAEELGLDRYSEKLYSDGIRFVDLERFHPERQFEDRPLSVGYLGRLDVEKRIPMLVEVAKELPDGIQFRFVGDGDYRETVERELADEIDAGDVTVTGWVDHDDVPRELNRMRLLLLTSEPTEGLPTVILEAFACGTPVYAAPVAGVPDVVRDGETGYTMSETDPVAIARRIEQAMKGGDLAELSDRCRREAEDRFSFEEAVTRYRTILDDVAR